MSKLKQIKIDAPEDFAVNIDLYVSGEKQGYFILKSCLSVSNPNEHKRPRLCHIFKHLVSI